MTKTFTILCVLAALAVAIPSSATDAPGDITQQVRVRAADVQFNPDTQEFTAIGSAQADYGPVTLTADQLVGSAASGDITASGHVQFKDAERTLTGDTFKYNYKTDVGLATNARAMSDKVYFRGAEMTASPEKYDLKGAMFTTCNLEKPHYYLAARELIFEPNSMLVAKGVRIVLYGKTIFYFPLYRTPIGSGNRRAGMRLPTFGAGDHSGIFAGYQFDLGPQSRSGGVLDARLSSKWFLQGGVKYESIAGGPVFARATYREPSYGGNKAFSVVTRLPEVGIKFGPKDLTDDYSTSKEQMMLSRGLIEPLKTRPSDKKINFVGELGVGRFSEEPEFNQAWRLDVRGMSWLRPVEIGRNTFFSPTVYARASRYQGGDTYTDLGLSLAAGRKLSDRSFVSVAYIAHAITGTTPFNFDAVDLPDELAARVGFPIGKFNMELMQRYDLNTHDIFDSEISLSKPMHCLEPKVTWKNRFRELTFSIGVVGF